MRLLAPLCLTLLFLLAGRCPAAKTAVPPADAPRRVLAGEHAGVLPVAFSPDGKSLAAGYANGIVRVWNAVTWQELAVRTAHVGAVRSLAFSPDGATLVTGGADGILRFWETGTWENIRALPLHVGIEALAFSPDGKRLALASQLFLTILDPATHNLVKQFLPTDCRGLFPASALAFSPDGKLLAAGGAGGTVMVWETDSWQCAREFLSGTPLVSLAFSPDGKLLAGGSQNGTTRLWHRNTWDLTRAFRGGLIGFVPHDGRLALTAANGIALVSPTSGKTAGIIFTAGPLVASFAPDGKTLVSGRADGMIRLWDTAAAQRNAKVQGHLSRGQVRVRQPNLEIAVGHPSDNAPEALWTQTAAGVPVRVIRVNLADPRVRITVQVAQGFPTGSESFSSMIARSQPTIAINGSYFDTASGEPIGSIVIGGRLVYEGAMGTAMAITSDKQALIRRVKRGRHEDWSGYETVLCCGPALVLNGNVDVLAEEEGFKDPHIMGSTRRMGVGLTADRHLLIVNTLAPVTFRRWGEVMRALGCAAAMNLDAGSSQAMYYRGRTLIPAGRPLTNLLLVYVDDGAGATTLASRSGSVSRSRRSHKNIPYGYPPAKESP